MKKQFQIGDFCFEIIYPEEMILPEHFMQFQTVRRAVSYTYEINSSDEIPQPGGKLLGQWPDMMVFGADSGESRLLGVKGALTPYALYKEKEVDRAEIAFLSSYLPMSKHDTVFVSLLALERHLLAYDSVVLHCSYMRYKGEAILFSAPSETGKTTQAKLWEEYRGSEIINGDRALLQEKDSIWSAKGWPVCGSSEECLNEETPIKAIVMLSQGRENCVERLRPAMAFSMLYGQITVNRWNVEASQKAVELLERLLQTVPVYHLSCTISEDAVTCLEKILYL